MEGEPGEVTIPRLTLGWKSLLHLDGISAESKYRISRLIERAVPLAGKMFVKTIKGKEMMKQCAEKTRVVRDQIESRGEHIYAALTELEKVYEEFLKLVYEFRVKAG
jgi:hypothetical protein